MIPKKIIPLVAILIFINNLPASADIIHIPGDYPTIQEGIDAANEYDTVLVKPGEYVENVDFIGKNITVASLFLTTGNPDFISSTIIDGNASGTVVVFENQEDSTAAIIGFTIRNGFTRNQDYPEIGGGIRCRNSHPIVDNNLIMDNTGCWGGGIACDEAAPIIRNNYIAGNMADY